MNDVCECGSIIKITEHCPDCGACWVPNINNKATALTNSLLIIMRQHVHIYDENVPELRDKMLKVISRDLKKFLPKEFNKTK